MSLVEEESSLPQSLLQKLYDATGSSTGGNRGFLLVYVNSEGEPVISGKTENSCVEMALTKLLELSLKDNEGLKR
jgi:hypothetical protein|tara:strand:+ start:948 stop:1172 length:225 start_codon:yes stop_codon:yes gene_type:complete